MAVTAAFPGLFPTALLRDAAAMQSPLAGATPSPLAGAGPPSLAAAALLQQPGVAPPPLVGGTLLPQPGAAPALRMPDVVVFSSAPFRVLAELANAGLQQVAALLPVIEQAVEDRSPVPLGHLAKAAGAAARQIADGHVALLAEGPDRVAAALPGQLASRATTPDSAAQLLRNLARQIGAELEPAVETKASENLRAAARQLGAASLDPAPRPIGDASADAVADPAQRWVSEAKHLLRSTGEALDQAGEQLRLQPGATAPTPPHTDWALAEIIAAQAQVATAFTRLGNVRFRASAPRATATMSFPSAFSLGQLTGATRLLGMALLIAILWLATGLWSLSASLVALAGTAYWVWRIYRATQGVTLDARQ